MQTFLAGIHCFVYLDAIVIALVVASLAVRFAKKFISLKMIRISQGLMFTHSKILPAGRIFVSGTHFALTTRACSVLTEHAKVEAG